MLLRRIALIAIALGFAAPAAPGQAPPPAPPYRAFPTLFPKYTGLNGYEDLVVASDMVHGIPAIQTAELAGATLKNMRAAIDDPAVQRALQILHAGLDKPMRSPRDPAGIDENTVFPEYAGFRGLARALAFEEYVALADGQVYRAADIMRDGLRLGYIVKGDTLIGTLVGIAIDSIVVRRFADHFDQMALRDCIHITAIAMEWLKSPSPEAAMYSAEHQTLLNNLTAWKSDPARLRAVVKESAPDDAPTSDDEMAAAELAGYLETNPGGAGALVDQAGALAAADYRAMVVEIHKPAWMRKPLQKFEARKDMAHRLYSMVTPFREQTVAKFDVDSARIHLLGVHGAIRRFQWENSRLPTNLRELKLPALTTDPFTGEPLVYKRTTTGYELYSAGGKGSDGGPIYLPRKQ